MKKMSWKGRARLSERGDVPGWVLITLMTAALGLIWGVASERLVEIFNRAMDSISGI